MTPISISPFAKTIALSSGRQSTGPVIASIINKFLDLPDQLRFKRLSKGIMSYENIARILLQRTSITWNEFLFIEKYCPPATQSNTITKIEWAPSYVNATDTDLEQIAQRFPRLQSLSLSSYSITEKGISCLKNLPLKHLDLINGRITENTIPSINGIRHSSHDLTHLMSVPLEHLNLSGSLREISIVTILIIYQMKHLRHLDINYARFQNGALNLLSTFHDPENELLENKLESLRISCDGIGDDDLPLIAKMPLRRLSLSDCFQISRFDHLARMRLEALEIRETIFLNGLNFMTEMPLQDVTLTMCNLTEGDLTILQGKQIERLVLRCSHLSNNHLIAIQTLPLCHLDLTGNLNLTNDALVYLKQMEQLQSLNLQNIAITDEGLASLQSLKNLQSLNLSCNKITDHGVAYLRQHTKLKKLNLSQTAITDEVFAHLKQMPLQTLEVFNCPYITKDRLDQFAKERPEIKIRRKADLSKMEVLDWFDKPWFHLTTPGRPTTQKVISVAVILILSLSFIASTVSILAFVLTSHTWTLITTPALIPGIYLSKYLADNYLP